MELTRFLESLIEDRCFYAVKRLSSNDTTLTKSNQAGIYLPGWYFENTVPEICRTDIHNPRITIPEVRFMDSGHVNRDAQAIYYNSKFHPELKLSKAYNEFRLTSWGGRRGGSPFQNPDNTGALIVFALARENEELIGRAWVCSSAQEEELVESWIGFDVLPGEVYGPLKLEKRTLTKRSISLADRVMLPEWNSEFPSGQEIFDRVAQVLPHGLGLSFDQLLLKRRELEFAVFSRIEGIHSLPRISEGFRSVDDFISYSLSVANRRKSRTGKSLELNLAYIFKDAGLEFEEQAVTENRKKPDFLFPSRNAYHNEEFPVEKLQMLAAKTCCKDRWRQVLSEADKIPVKHLFTLQEGLSINQFEEMKSSNIRLVIPSPNMGKFPVEIRDELGSLSGFVEFIHSTQNELFAR